jgi:hypothetical protein
MDLNTLMAQNQFQENRPLPLTIGFAQRQHGRDVYYIDHRHAG